MAAAMALLMVCLAGAAATRINYDILTYLPPDLDSSQGEKLLEEPFHMAATTMLIVEEMPPEYTNQLCKDIQEVPGVSSALWISSAAGIQIPKDFLPTELRDMFFSGDATMLIVQYENPGASAIKSASWPVFRLSLRTPRTWWTRSFPSTWVWPFSSPCW